MTKTTNNFRKQTIVNAVAKWHAHYLADLSRDYTYQKYYSCDDLEWNDEPVTDDEYKLKLVTELGYEFAEDCLTKTEWKAIGYLAEKYGDAWKMEPEEMAKLIDGCQCAYTTFEEYMGEKRPQGAWDYITDVLDWAEYVSDEVCKERRTGVRADISLKHQNETNNKLFRDAVNMLEVTRTPITINNIESTMKNMKK